MVGMIIPGLPTTIFMIIAAYCFIKSNKRLYKWIINHKSFGSNVKNYLDGNGMPRKAKSKAIMVMWIFVFSSIFFFIPKGLMTLKAITLISAFAGTGAILATRSSD